MSYSLWNKALAARYFNPSMSGRMVLLHCTRDIIEQVGRADGLGGYQDFLCALRSLNTPIQMGHSWEQRMREQPLMGPHSPPPYLGVLIMMVLAWTEREASQASYHESLEQFLNEEVNGACGEETNESEGQPAPRISFVEGLMKHLHHWSCVQQRGELGLFHNLRRNSHRFVGLILHQALLPQHEVALLPWLFSGLGLHPGGTLAAPVLRQMISSLEEQEWLPELRRLLLIPNKEIQEHLDELLTDALENWDGTATPPQDQGGQEDPPSVMVLACLDKDENPMVRLFSTEIRGTATLHVEGTQVHCSLNEHGFTRPLDALALGLMPWKLWMAPELAGCMQDGVPIPLESNNEVPATLIPENQAGLVGTGFIQGLSPIPEALCYSIVRRGKAPAEWQREVSRPWMADFSTQMTVHAGVVPRMQASASNHGSPTPRVSLVGGKKANGSAYYHPWGLPLLQATGYAGSLSAGFRFADKEIHIDFPEPATGIAVRSIPLECVEELTAGLEMKAVEISILHNGEYVRRMPLVVGLALPYAHGKDDEQFGMDLSMVMPQDTGKIGFGQIFAPMPEAPLDYARLLLPMRPQFQEPCGLHPLLCALVRSSGRLGELSVEKLREQVGEWLEKTERQSGRHEVSGWLRALQALGFIGLNYIEMRARLAPISMIMMPGDFHSVRCLVTGMVTPPVLQEMRSFIDGALEPLSLEWIHDGQAPSIPLLSSTSLYGLRSMQDHLNARFPNAVHFHSSLQYSLAILRSIPSVKDQLSKIQLEPPPRVVFSPTEERFDPDGKAFAISGQVPEFPMLTRRNTSQFHQGQVHTWWESEARGWWVPKEWVWPWLCHLCGNQAFYPDPEAGTHLLVSNVFHRLPASVEHALVMSSGRLPAMKVMKGQPAYSYADIPNKLRRELSRIFCGSTSSETLSRFQKQAFT